MRETVKRKTYNLDEELIGRFRTPYRREIVKGKKLVLALFCTMGIATGALLSLGGCTTGSPEEIDKTLKATAQWEQEMKEQKERQEELKRRSR